MNIPRKNRRELAQIFSELTGNFVPAPANVTPILPRMQKIKAVVFDVYGTLFQSAVGDISLIDQAGSGLREQAFKEVFSLFGIQVSTQNYSLNDTFKEVIKRQQEEIRMSGISYPEVDIISVWAEWLQELLARSVLDNRVTLTALNLEQMAIEFEARANPVSPMPNAREVIEHFHKAGYLLGIVSNAQFFTMLLFESFFNLSHTEMGFTPDLCVWSFDHLRAKPGTELYEICAHTLIQSYGILPNEVLYVGNDRRNDVWPAQLCGFRTALFAGDLRSYRPRDEDDEIKKIQPDALLTDLSQIRQLVGN